MLNTAKMSTLGEMAAGVAHEVNNPLGIIVGKIDILKSRLNAGEVPKDRLITDLSKIETVVVRIAKIVSGLRAFARDTGGDPFQATELESIVEQTLNFCSENLKLFQHRHQSQRRS